MSNMIVEDVERCPLPNNLLCTFSVYLPKIGLTIRKCKLLKGARGNFIAMPTHSKKVDEEWVNTVLVQWTKDKSIKFQQDLIPLVERALEQAP